MTDLRKAAEMALDALRYTCDHLPAKTGVEREVDEAITALQIALAQPEQEPVAMRYDYDGFGYQYIDSGSGSNWQTRIKDAEPLYVAPPQREWVGLTEEEVDSYALDIGVTANKAPQWLVKYAKDVEAKLKDKNSALYTKPEPVDWEAVAADQAMTIAMMQIENKKEWVGLTTAEVIQCQEVYYYDTYQNIEAELKEKNG